ncbi:DUF397 domain-containing protein [Streptomyces sp. S6]
MTTEVSLRWIKSSYSDPGTGGNCVEVALWTKSSYSNPGNGGECVEVALNLAAQGITVPVRDSKSPDGPVLGFSTSAFTSFTESLKA